MFENFIKAYKDVYFRSFADDFYGDFKRFEQALLEPKFHPSDELKDELRALDRFLCEPVKIAIVGQFSSGKSTFLNALLGRQILPTGITPVTARITHIAYAPTYALSVLYKNGTRASLDVGELGRFVDQRVHNDDVSELCIYAPVPLLKRVNFIDTPGLNSLSDSDTKITKSVLQDVGAIIWLSLIDNAARASELADIENFLQHSDKIAICVLNQKDKLTEQELQNVINHANATFGEYFKQIIAISAKQANQALESGDEKMLQSSNFKDILEFLDTLDTGLIKQSFITNRRKQIISSLCSQYKFFAEIYDEADGILQTYKDELGAMMSEFKANFSPRLALSFEQIQEAAKLISDEILSSLKPIKSSRFVVKKSLLKGEIYEKNDYEMIGFSSDEVLSKLIYNDVKLDKFFKIYRRNLKLLEEQMRDGLDAFYTRLEREFLIYKARYESIYKDDVRHSNIEYSAIRKYAGEIYGLFLREFESVKFQTQQRVSLFFEKLNLKVASNYESAIKIVTYSTLDKITSAAKSYERDPLRSSIYVPSAADISQSVLNALNLHEFESEMLSNVSFLNKFSAQLQDSFTKLCDEKSKNLQELKARNLGIKKELECLVAL